MSNMRKKDCIAAVNEVLHVITNHDCFHQIKEEMGLNDEELEIILSSVVTDVDNDDIE